MRAVPHEVKGFAQIPLRKCSSAFASISTETIGRLAISSSVFGDKHQVK